MKTIRRRFLLFAMGFSGLLSLNSCGFVRLLGTTDQLDETEQEATEYLKSNGYSYDYAFMMTDSLWYLLNSDSLVLNLYKHARGVNASPIQLRVFDRNGKFVTAYSQCYAGFKQRNILETYPPKVFDWWPSNPNLIFSNELKIMDINDAEKSILLDRIHKYDYTMVLYWNIWSNYFSKVVLKEASKYREEHNSNGESVQLILVNTAITMSENEH